MPETRVATFRMTQGVGQDLPGVFAPPEVWSAASNMVWRDGCLERIRGFTADSAATLPAPLYPDLKQFHTEDYTATGGGTSNERWKLIAGCKSGGLAKVVDITNAGTTADVTPATWAGTDGEFWQIGSFSPRFVYVNNSNQPPGYYDVSAGGACAAFFGWGPTGSATDKAMVMRSFGDFMIAMNLLAGAGAAAPWVVGTQYRTAIFWSGLGSATAFPGAWVPAVGNLAGSLQLTGPGGSIWDAGQLRESFYIYRRGSVWQLDRVADNQVFVARPVFRGWGAWGPGSVGTDGNLAYCFTGNDLIAHDGQRWQSVLAGKVRRRLLETDIPNDSVWYKARVFLHQERNEVWCAYPGPGSSYLNRAIVHDLASGTSSIRELPACRDIQPVYTLGDAVEKGQLLAFTQGEQDWFNPDSGNDFPSSVTIGAYAAKEHLDFGLPHKRKLIQWVRPIVYSVGGSAVTIACSVASLDAPYLSDTYGTPVNWTLGTDDKADLFAEGRFLSFKFASSGGAPYRLAGFDVGYTVAGTH